MRKLIRFILAWIASPVILIIVVPAFAAFDWLDDHHGTAKHVFNGWFAWATFK